MKKSLVALAALAVAGVASAQSSVTLFGVVDVGVSYYQTTSKDINGIQPSVKQSQWALSSGNETAGRLGFRGVEDLGGGLAASFWLEAGLSGDTGAMGSTGPTGTFFNRRSTVSLSGNFGELRLGRDYTPTFWNNTNFDPFNVNGVGANAIHVFLGGYDDNTNYIRRSNTIGYFLPPNLGGFYGQVQYAFDENVQTSGYPSTNAGRYAGGRVGYANGPLDVALAYGQSDIAPLLAPPPLSPAILQSGVTNKVQTTNLGASYDFGFLKLMGEYSHISFNNDVINVPNSKADGYLLGVTAPVGPGLIKASYSRVDLNRGVEGWANARADKLALGYVYNMSKRTALYATFAYTRNKNYMDLTAGGSPDYVVPVPGTPSATYAPDKAYGYDFGIRHSF